MIKALIREKFVRQYKFIAKVKGKYEFQKTLLSWELDKQEILNLDLTLLDENPGFPVLVYQFGKVGSSTIFRSLEMSGVNAVQIHGLTLRFWNLMADYGGKEWIEVVRLMRIHAWKTRRMLEKERYVRTKANSSNKFYIITMTREPISYLLSSLFQFLAHTNYGRGLITSYEKTPDKALNDLKKLVLDVVSYKTVYNSSIPENVPQHAMELDENNDKESLYKFLMTGSDNYIQSWFDTEILSVFGADVLGSPFNFHNGYKIYETDQAKILLLRFEDLFTKIDILSVLSDFLNREIKSTVDSNKTSEKNIANFYHDFCQDITFPRDFLISQYSSKYVSHFYSSSEISDFLTKWSDPS